MHEPSARIDELARLIVDCALAVHKALGAGHIESVYEEALCIELTDRNVPFRRQVPIDVHYRDRRVGSHRLDLVVDDLVIVELKAVAALAPIHQAQALSYLRASGLRLALLINFDVPLLRTGIRRIISTR
jgi:GxxExxY protein